MIMDSNGIFSDPFNLTRIYNTELNLTLSLVPAKLIKQVPLNTIARAVKTGVLDGGQKIVRAVKIGLQGINEARDFTYTYIRDEMVKNAPTYLKQYVDGYNADSVSKVA